MDAYDHCAGLVRRGDRDRYIAGLFVPQPARQHLYALQALNLEVGSVAGRVSEPIAGEIRLQWWRDALAGQAEGAAGHPVAAAVTATLAECGLPVDPLAALIDAHIFDLYDEPMPSLAGLEAYSRAIEGTLRHLAALMIAGADVDGLEIAADRAGMAIGLAATLAGLPRTARHPSYLPADLAAAHGLEPTDSLGGADHEAVRPLIADVAAAGRRHLRAAEEAVAALPLLVRLAFLPLALAGPVFDRVTAKRFDPRVGGGPSPLGRYWLLWRAALRARR